MEWVYDPSDVGSRSTGSDPGIHFWGDPRTCLVASLAHTALNVSSACNIGSIIKHMLALCGGSLERQLQVAGGRVSHELVNVPRSASGLSDSLCWLLSQNTADAWDLIRSNKILFCGAFYFMCASIVAYCVPMYAACTYMRVLCPTQGFRNKLMISGVQSTHFQ